MILKFTLLLSVALFAGCATPVDQPVTNVYKNKPYVFDLDGMYFSDDALKCLTDSNNQTKQ